MLARGVVSTSIINGLGGAPHASLGQMRAMSITGGALGRVWVLWHALVRTFVFGHVCLCVGLFCGGEYTIKGTSGEIVIAGHQVHEWEMYGQFWNQGGWD